MLRALLPLLLIALVLLAVSLWPAPGASGAPDVARVECDRPATLRLHRFEDGSARLECAGRALVRVSVPD
jgi:hypothetical protein